MFAKLSPACKPNAAAGLSDTGFAMRMKPFFTGLLSRIFSRQAATAQRPKRFAKIVAHTFCSTASANTFQSVAFDILFGAAGFQIQIHKPYALTMLNLKGFFLSNSTTFPGFHSPLASKARPVAHERPTCYARVLRNGCTCCQIRLNPPGLRLQTQPEFLGMATSAQ